MVFIIVYTVNTAALAPHSSLRLILTPESYRFLRGKTVDKKRYDQWKEQNKSSADDDQVEMQGSDYCDAENSNHVKDDAKLLMVKT